MMFSLTPVVRFVLILVIATFAATFFADKAGIPLFGMMALHTANSPAFFPTQIITYMFCHDITSIFHLFFNMLMFVSFGPQLEMYLGSRRFGNFIIICGIGVGTSWLLWNQFDLLHMAEGGAMVGFSGVLFGIFALMGLYFPEAMVMLLLPPIPVKMKYMVIGYILIEFFMLLNNSVGDNISHISHLLGVVFAVIMYYLWPILGKK